MPDNRSAKSKKRRKTRQNKKNNKANDVACSNIPENDLNNSTEVDSEVSSPSVAPTEATVSGSVQVGVAEQCDVGYNRDIASENDLSNCESVTLIKSVSSESNLNFNKSASIVELNEHTYNVESPERSLKKPPKQKLLHVAKSKSLDNDEDSQLNIVEITEYYEGDSNDEKSEKSMLVASNAVISEADSDIEWEVADNLQEKVAIDRPTVKGTLSIETLSLEQAECEHTQSLSPEEELSLRQYLQSLHLATSSDVSPLENTANECETDIYVNNAEKSSSKGRKKATAEEITRHATLKPRFLEVIDEEGSSESSLTTRRHSYLHEEKNEFDDLEDDVFIDNQQKIKQHNDNFPKGFTNNKNKNDKSNIHQECLLLDTKFIEPIIKEGCGDWKLETLERIDGAEVVYLDDSSSSTSDIYDILEEGEEMQEFDENVQILTPIIEMEAAGIAKPNFSDMGRSLKTPPPSPQVSFDIDGSIETFERHLSQSETKIPLSEAHNVQPEAQISQFEPIKIIYHKIELQLLENNDSDEVVLNKNSNNAQNKLDPTVLINDVKPNSNLLPGDKKSTSSDSFSNSIGEKSVSIPIANQKCDFPARGNEKIIPTVLVDKKCNMASMSVPEKTIPVTHIKPKSYSTDISADETTNSIVHVQSKSNQSALNHEKLNSISTNVKEQSVSNVHVNSRSSSNQKSNSTISVRKQINSTVLVNEKSNTTIEEECKMALTPVEETIIPITLVNQQSDWNVQVDEKITPTVIVDEKLKTASLPAEEKIIPIILVNQKSSTNVQVDEKIIPIVAIDNKFKTVSLPVQDENTSVTLVEQTSNSNVGVNENSIPTAVLNKKLTTISIPVQEKIIPITLDNQKSSTNVQVDEKIIPIVASDNKFKTVSLPVQEENTSVTLVEQTSNSNVGANENIIPTAVVNKKSTTILIPVQEKIIPITLDNQKSRTNVQVDEKIIPIVASDNKFKTVSLPVQEENTSVTLVEQTSNSNVGVNENSIPTAVLNKKSTTISIPVQEKIIPITLVNQTSSSNIQSDQRMLSTAIVDEILTTTSLSVQEKIIPIVLEDQKSTSNLRINEKSIPTVVVDEKCKMASTPVEEKIVPITLAYEKSSSKQVDEKIVTVLIDEKRRASSKDAEDTIISNTPVYHKSDSTLPVVQKIIPITLVNQKCDSSAPIDEKNIPTVLVQDKTNTKSATDEKHISTSTSYKEKLINHQFMSTVHPGEKSIPVKLDDVKSNTNILLIDEKSNVTSNAVQQKPELITLDNSKPDLSPLGDKIIDSTVQNISKANDLGGEKSNSILSAETKDKSDSDINSLKDELNAALLNLMQQVTEDSNESKYTYIDTAYCRQDSSSSIASSQSQSTARYNPNTSSLTDIATILHDDFSNTDLKTNVDESKSHVKEVIECITDSTSKIAIPDPGLKQPSTLKEICIDKIAELPYGKAILEELANLSESLKAVITVNSGILNHTNTYADILDKMLLQTKQTRDYSVLSSKDYRPLNYTKIPPPPVAPRKSSLKITTEDVLKNKSNAVSSPFALITDKTSRLHDANDVNCKNVGHNTYRVDTTHQESKKSDITKSTNISTSPFKSQTGNRLLAIIQDPSINVNLKQFRTTSSPSLEHKVSSSTNTLNFKKESIYNLNTGIKKSVENDIHKTYIHPEAPIPPPRIRKYKTTNYESDDSSEMTDSSHYSRSERKHFYSSLGNINEDFESSTSASHLQYLYKKSSRAKDHIDHFSDSTYSDIESNAPRRRLSLPRDICDQQMEYILSKEKQIEDEIKRLETSRDWIKGPRAPLLSEKQYQEENLFDTKKFHISRRGDFAVFSESGSTLNERPRPAHLTSSQEELFREKMYTEYMNKFAERAERKQHKIIKITSAPLTADYRHNSQSLPILNHSLNQEIKKTCNKIEEEFISKAKQRWDKIGFKDPETDDEREKAKSQNKSVVVEHKIKVIEEGKEKDMARLPNHLREFVQFTAGDKDPATSSPGESITGKTSLFVVICAFFVVAFELGRSFWPSFKKS